MARRESIGWQEAVTRLAGERTRAETCAGLLKKHGNAAALSRGALAYGEAKAEADAVIAGLVAALAAGKKPTSLPDLEARLARGIEAREAFCAQVMALLPDTSGDKDGLSDVLGLGEVLTKMIEAVKELVLRCADEDALTRKTIRTQLEAASWPDFAAVPPSP
jgi:hypothetical protein